jgi:hypothetical protein
MGLTSERNSWKVVALVYSGKADPKWQLSTEQAHHFIELWNRAANASNEVVIPSILGFKGIRLLSGNKQCLIYNGVITCLKGGRKFSKMDEERKIEKFLLGTAPERTAKLLKKLNIS